MVYGLDNLKIWGIELAKCKENSKTNQTSITTNISMVLSCL